MPAITGFDINMFDANLMLCPSRFGGIGIRDPIKTATISYKASFESSAILQNAIISGTPVDLHQHSQHSQTTRKLSKQYADLQHIQEVQSLIDSIQDKDQKEHLKRITSNKCAAWLSANPWEDEYFAMTLHEFKDSMACRYGKVPQGLQTYCDGCGDLFDMNHALNCKNGGLVYQRHNELRDENCDLMKKAGFSQVLCEPIVKEAGEDGLGELRGDWSARGFWIRQKVAVFDTRIFNAKAPSYKSLSLEAAFNIHRNEKKNLYNDAVEQKRGSFTPILATCEGILDREAEAYVKRLALHLSKKWDKTYSQIVFWVRARLQLCILKSVSNCFRGSRSKWRGGNILDGAAMPFMTD